MLRRITGEIASRFLQRWRIHLTAKQTLANYQGLYKNRPDFDRNFHDTIRFAKHKRFRSLRDRVWISRFARNSDGPPRVLGFGILWALNLTRLCRVMHKPLVRLVNLTFSLYARSKFTFRPLRDRVLNFPFPLRGNWIGRFASEIFGASHQTKDCASCGPYNKPLRGL